MNGSGIIKEDTPGETGDRAASNASDIPLLKTGRDYDFYVIGIANREDLSLDERVKHIQNAYSQLEDKIDVNVPIDVRFVDKIFENGYIAYYWPKYFGFDRDSIRSIARDNPLPNLWYRVGPMWGSTFTTMPETGKVPTISDLSLPYIDNPVARHHGSFNVNDYFDVIDSIRNNDLYAGLDKELEWYEDSYDCVNTDPKILPHSVNKDIEILAYTKF